MKLLQGILTALIALALVICAFLFGAKWQEGQCWDNEAAFRVALTGEWERANLFYHLIQLEEQRRRAELKRLRHPQAFYRPDPWGRYLPTLTPLPADTVVAWDTKWYPESLIVNTDGVTWINPIALKPVVKFQWYYDPTAKLIKAYPDTDWVEIEI
jgi:hypothetical protein